MERRAGLVARAVAARQRGGVAQAEQVGAARRVQIGERERLRADAAAQLEQVAADRVRAAVRVVEAALVLVAQAGERAVQPAVDVLDGHAERAARALHGERRRRAVEGAVREVAVSLPRAGRLDRAERERAGAAARGRAERRGRAREEIARDPRQIGRRAGRVSGMPSSVTAVCEGSWPSSETVVPLRASPSSSETPGCFPSASSSVGESRRSGLAGPSPSPLARRATTTDPIDLSALPRTSLTWIVTVSPARTSKRCEAIGA